jgi:hypothetical protein
MPEIYLLAGSREPGRRAGREQLKVLLEHFGDEDPVVNLAKEEIASISRTAVKLN